MPRRSRDSALGVYRKGLFPPGALKRDAAQGQRVGFGATVTAEEFRQCGVRGQRVGVTVYEMHEIVGRICRKFTILDVAFLYCNISVVTVVL